MNRNLILKSLRFVKFDSICLYWQFLDIQMSIFRRVSCQSEPIVGQICHPSLAVVFPILKVLINHCVTVRRYVIICVTDFVMDRRTAKQKIQVDSKFR